MKLKNIEIGNEYQFKTKEEVMKIISEIENEYNCTVMPHFFDEEHINMFVDKKVTVINTDSCLDKPNSHKDLLSVSVKLKHGGFNLWVSHKFLRKIK